MTLPATFTPAWLADDMAALCNIGSYSRVLDPSYGKGALLEAAGNSTSLLSGVELNENLVARASTDHLVVRADFLKWKPTQIFDRILMNPPKTDPALHVARAMEILDKGGRLVALLHRDVIGPGMAESINARLYHLPDHTFNIGGEPILATIMVWDKPRG